MSPAPAELDDVFAGDVVGLVEVVVGGKVEPMFWKIVQWAQVVISLIREAEDLLGPGKGEEKKAYVVAGATRELELAATTVQVGGCESDELLAYVGNVIDGVVGLFNCFGIFRRSSEGSRSAAISAAAAAPPPAGGSS